MILVVCYFVYFVVVCVGVLFVDGWIVDVFLYCFCYELLFDLICMQLFWMCEYVWIGMFEQIVLFCEMWIECGMWMIEVLCLLNVIDFVNDLFFGCGGKIVVNSQCEQNLKFELLILIEYDDCQIVCLSFNYYMDYFGLLWDICIVMGDVVYMGCVGFGFEWFMFVLFCYYGFDIDVWLCEVCDVLWGM